ncbi:MAG: hypothetical protein HOG49_12880 [Candidatus Scalindua sp.]|jgi:hypothetical protein|nr:hypothetical protein [Candidatus Scalindua sp.]
MASYEKKTVKIIIAHPYDYDDLEGKLEDVQEVLRHIIALSRQQTGVDNPDVRFTAVCSQFNSWDDRIELDELEVSVSRKETDEEFTIRTNVLKDRAKKSEITRKRNATRRKNKKEKDDFELYKQLEKRFKK